MELSKEDIETEKELIMLAEFYGYHVKDFKGTLYLEYKGVEDDDYATNASTVDHLWKFTFDWNWLIPVARKITKDFQKFKKVETEEEKKFFDEYLDLMTNIKAEAMSFDIDHFYIEIVKFIKWYNNK